MNLTLVDGLAIRTFVDTDFSGEGSDVMYSYIPAGEMWLDKVLEDEKDFFVALHNFERELLLGGLSYADTRRRVCEKFVSKNEQKPNVVIDTYKWFPKDRDLQVLIVDGQMVREFYDPKFIQGGHDLVYSYIPQRTIWVEKAFEKEYDFTLIHEAYERRRMLEGMKYIDAHNLALRVEKSERIKVVRERFDFIP